MYCCGMPFRNGCFVGFRTALLAAVRTCFGIRPALLPAFLVLVVGAGPAAAQQDVPDAGGRVYGLVGAGIGDGVSVATGVGAGVRVTPRLGLDLEVTHLVGPGGGAGAPSFGGPLLPGLGLPGPGDLFPFLRVETQGTDVTAFLTKFTVEFPVADGLLFPYLSGGGGVGRVEERASIVVDPAALIPSAAQGALPGPGIAVPIDSTELGLALALGGGVDVRLWRGFAVGVDLRWLRVLRAHDPLDTAQLAARVSYRF